MNDLTEYKDIIISSSMPDREERQVEETLKAAYNLASSGNAITSMTEAMRMIEDPITHKSDIKRKKMQNGRK